MKIKTVLLALVIAGIFFLSFLRILSERANRFVEISLNSEDIYRLARQNNLKVDLVVERLSAIGVGSVILKETTISELKNKGRLISFFPEDTGHLKLLDLIEPKSPVNQPAIVSRDKELILQIKEVLKSRYAVATEMEAISAKYYLLKFPDFFPEIKNLEIGADLEEVNLFHRAGMKVGLLLKNAGMVPGLVEVLKNIDRVIPKENEVFGFSTPDNFSDIISFGNFLLTNKILFCDFEFNSVLGRDLLLKNFPEISLRSHLISPLEYRNGLSLLSSQLRIRRAVKERNIRLILISLPERIPLEDMFNWLRNLIKDIGRDGFVVEFARPVPFPRIGFLGIRKLLGFCSLLFFPVLGCYAAQKMSGSSALTRYLLINFITFSEGLILAIIGSDIYFQQNIVSLSGIKVAALGSFLLGGVLLFTFSGIKHYLQKPVSLGWLTAGGMAAIVIGYWLWRSGNLAVPLPGESFIRQMLEGLFYVRPRFKEFLVGQPALFLGLVYDQKLLVLVGLIGQISILNTFAHFHTPVLVSIFRTFLGIVLGLGIGLVINLLLQRVKK